MKDGCVIWICGLSGSGKSTIGTMLFNKIKLILSNVIYLDGDTLRELLECTEYGRQERLHVAIKRAKFCRLMSDQGINVVCTTVSMFREVYEYNKCFNNFYDVYIKCGIEELRKRDQKGLYSGCEMGIQKNVVGVDLVFDTPNAKMTIDNTKCGGLQEKVDLIYGSVEPLLAR